MSARQETLRYNVGICLPFSEIDIYLKTETNARACLVDTNFLIAVSDKEHTFHDDAQFLHEKLVENAIAIMVNVSARAEYIDYQRRVIATENLMAMLAPSSKWKISASVREMLQKQKAWIYGQARNEKDTYLTDARIKICKQTFSPKNSSGQIGWLKFCEEYLDGQLSEAWETIEKRLPLNYIDMRADDSHDHFRKELRWEEMYRLCEATALGSQDAMLLNLLDSSVFPFIVTMDFDLAYGVMATTKDKVALVPDNLYRNRLRKLKF